MDAVLSVLLVLGAGVAGLAIGAAILYMVVALLALRTIKAASTTITNGLRYHPGLGGRRGR